MAKIEYSKSVFLVSNTRSSLPCAIGISVAKLCVPLCRPSSLRFSCSLHLRLIFVVTGAPRFFARPKPAFGLRSCRVFVLRFYRELRRFPRKCEAKRLCVVPFSLNKFGFSTAQTFRHEAFFFPFALVRHGLSHEFRSRALRCTHSHIKNFCSQNFIGAGVLCISDFAFRHFKSSGADGLVQPKR